MPLPHESLVAWQRADDLYIDAQVKSELDTELRGVDAPLRALMRHYVNRRK